MHVVATQALWAMQYPTYLAELLKIETNNCFSHVVFSSLILGCFKADLSFHSNKSHYFNWVDRSLMFWFDNVPSCFDTLWKKKRKKKKHCLAAVHAGFFKKTHLCIILKNSQANLRCIKRPQRHLHWSRIYFHTPSSSFTGCDSRSFWLSF